MKQLLLCMAMTRSRYKRYKRFWLIDEGDDVGMQMELFLKKQLLEASMAAWHDDRSTYLFMYCIVASIQITHDKEIETEGAEFRPTYIVVPNAPCLHLQSYCGIKAIVLFIALSSRRRWGWIVVTSVILDAKRG